MNAIENLRKTRPDVAIEVIWTVDETYQWDGDGPDPETEGLLPYDVDVTARAIRYGLLIEGTDSLGGVYSDDGGKSDPEINGYLDGLVDRALKELDRQLAPVTPAQFHLRCAAAGIDICIAWEEPEIARAFRDGAPVAIIEHLINTRF